MCMISSQCLANVNYRDIITIIIDPFNEFDLHERVCNLRDHDQEEEKRSVYDWAAPVFKNILQYVSKVDVKTAERDTGILREAQPI